MDQHKFSISVTDENISMHNQVSSNQSTGELTMASLKAQTEMHDFYVKTSDQSISAIKLKTNENGSISSGGSSGKNTWLKWAIYYFPTAFISIIFIIIIIIAIITTATTTIIIIISSIIIIGNIIIIIIFIIIITLTFLFCLY